MIERGGLLNLKPSIFRVVKIVNIKITKDDLYLFQIDYNFR